MTKYDVQSQFTVKDQVIAITGGTGILGSEIACSLAEAGAKIALLDIRTELADNLKQRLDASGSQYNIFQCDVLDRDSVQSAFEAIVSEFGKVDTLINGAGGNHPKGTTSAELSFFDMPTEAFNWVMQLNLTGSVLPSQIFGKYFARQDAGNILNLSSMSAFQPLTRVGAYSAAKAAVSNFTQWLAVHMAQEYSKNIRVNALAPGFFLTNQNRFLLTEEKTGNLTARGQSIIDHTPMAKFGDPADLIGSIIWLLSPAASFVTGIVLPVDGGFSAFSGV